MRLLAFAVLASVWASVFGQSSSVDSYVASESPIARAGLLANIGPNGSKSAGAKVSEASFSRHANIAHLLLHQAGIVIASPSTSNPDYLYTWVRDSSLVFKEIIDQYTSGRDTSTRSLIDQFVSAEATLQQVSNPSGTVTTGGLGEPKFNIDETAFTGAWGRPQRGQFDMLSHGDCLNSFLCRRTCASCDGNY
jgi:glucoamylase